MSLDTTRILIVDDEKRILESFSPILEDLGFYVRTASSASDAMSLIKDDYFNIAFVDHFLGPERGLELIAKMSESEPDLYFVLITANGNTDLAVEALKKGASDFISKPFFVADLMKSIEFINRKRDLDIQKKDMMRILESRLAEKTEELNKVYFPVLESLAQAMEKKDIGTYGHSMRVRHYSGMIASVLDLNETDVENLKVAAMLHDIGKIGTSDFILGKPGALTDEELRNVRNHPQKGVEILKPLLKTFRQLDAILPAIMHHHENFDGSGYPHKLRGQEIPLLARIISVADTYDAILSNRPYRAASHHNKALDELTRFCGVQFDKEIVYAFAVANGNSYLIGQRGHQLNVLQENHLDSQ